MVTFLAVFAAALLASPILAAPLSGQELEPRAITSYCSKFKKVCASACDDAGRAAGTKSVCKPTGTNLFRFGCHCADGTDLLATALQRVTGYAAEVVTTKGSATRVVTSTAYNFTNAYTTPVVKTTARRTISSFTATSGTTTAYVYQPSSYAGGDIPARRATTPPLCKAFSSTCSKVCKSKDDTTSTNACSKVSGSSTSDEYKLECKCSKSAKQLNEDVLNAFGGSLIKPTTTLTRTVRATSTKQVQETRVSSRVLTAPTSTRTSFVGTTTIKTVDVAVETSSLPLTGRIRIDRLNPGKDNATLGYITVPQPPGGDDPGSITADADENYAAPVTMVLEDTSDKNVWGINWKTPGASYYVTNLVNGDYADDEPGSGCGESVLNWETGISPFGPLQGEFEYYAPDPRETYTWTFDPSERNKVNPDRKVQIPLRPFWYRSDGTYLRPNAIYTTDQSDPYNYRPLYFSDGTAANNKCGDGGNIDVRYYFEPDAPSSQ